MKRQRSLIPLAAVLMSTALAAPAAAQAPFTIENVAVAGTGCDDSTTSIRTSEQGRSQQLSVRFRDFNAQGRPAVVLDDGQRRAVPGVAGCQIAALLTPAPGFQVALVDIELRGQANVSGPRDTDLGLNNVARVSREYFFNAPGGNVLPILTTRIANTRGPFSITDDFRLLTFAGCNASVIARASLNLVVTGEGNSASIRRLNESSTVRFGFAARPCDGNAPDQGPVLLPGDRASVPTYRSVCILEGDDPRLQVCYGRSGRAYSADFDPDL